MATIIEEIAFTVNETKCTYKLFKYEEMAIKKVKVPFETEKTSSFKGYNYEDIKVKTKKYALHQILDNKEEIRDTLICETEMYGTILTILKGILTEYIKTIDKLQAPTL